MKFTTNDFKAYALRFLAKLGCTVHYPEYDEEMAQTAAATCQNLNWPKILVVFCSASAIEMSLLSAQIHSQLPAIFCSLGLVTIFSFTCFFVSKGTHLNYPLVAHVLERFGIFFGVTAIFISITIPFPLWFKCITCFVYVISWFAILFSNYSYAQQQTNAKAHMSVTDSQLL